MPKFSQTIKDFTNHKNASTKLFTPGPGSLLPENIMGIAPCFGRNDLAYERAESEVLNALRAKTGHDKIIRLQGSASLAIEIAIRNFVFGRVLLVDSGIYSARMGLMLTTQSHFAQQPLEIVSVDWSDLDSVSGKFDWVVACHVETSVGLKLPIDTVRSVADRIHARVLLDATASVGLESRLELADVIAYSSCKGLFGLTGAAFVSSHSLPTLEVDSFYLSYDNHRSKKMTGPYHSILSLLHVLPKHSFVKDSVLINKEKCLKKFASAIPLAEYLQPLLCTRLSAEISSGEPGAVLYESRADISGSIVCHLGELHLGSLAKGDILEKLEAH